MSTQQIRVIQSDAPADHLAWPAKVYPKTQMTPAELTHAEAMATWGDEHEAIANAAIVRAIDDGQVIPLNLVEALVQHVLEKAAASVPLEFRPRVQSSVDAPAVIASLRK